MKLRSTTIVPAGGWYHRQPETSFLIEAENLNTLITRIIQHRTYKDINRITRKSVYEDIDNQICKRLDKAGAKDFIIYEQ